MGEDYLKKKRKKKKKKLWENLAEFLCLHGEGKTMEGIRGVRAVPQHDSGK